LRASIAQEKEIMRLKKTVALAATTTFLVSATLSLADPATQWRSWAPIWQGVARSWENHPHRLSLFGSELRSGEMDSGFLTGSVWGRMKIGSFPSDSVTCRTVGRVVASKYLTFLPGSASVTVSGRLGEAAEGSQRVEVDLDAWANANATVLLAGIDVNSAIDEGWHQQGLEWGVRRIRRVAAGRLAFEAFVRIRATNSPDPLTRHHGTWTYRVRVPYLVVSGERSHTAFTVGGTATTIDSVHAAPPRPNALARFTRVVGEGGSARRYTSAFIGLTQTGYSFDCPDTRLDGRYMREVELFLDRETYEPAKRSHFFDMHHYFSNAGTIEHAFTATLRSLFVLIEVDDAGGRFERIADTKVIQHPELSYEQPFYVPR
jgi:hypothetical protein